MRGSPKRRDGGSYDGRSARCTPTACGWGSGPTILDRIVATTRSCFISDPDVEGRCALEIRPSSVRSVEIVRAGGRRSPVSGLIVLVASLVAIAWDRR